MNVNMNTREYQILQDFLPQNEKPEVEIVEHALGGGRILAPAHIYATQSEIIIIRAHRIGLYRKVKVIKYNTMTGIILNRGIRFYRLHFGVIGEENAHEDENVPGNRKVWVYGLAHKEVMVLVHFLSGINGKIPVYGRGT